MSAVLGASGTTTRSIVARRPILAFVLLALPLAIGLEGVVALAQYDVLPGKGWPAELGLDMEEAASVLLVAAIFTTAVGVTWAVEGRAGIRTMLRRLTRWRAPLRWWLVAVLAMPVLTTLLAVALGDQARMPSRSTIAAEILAIAVAFLLANLGEEATWYGFMQTRLEHRHRFVTAAAVTALPFSLVHLPLRVITGEATTPGALFANFLTLAVFGVFFRSYVAIVGRCGADSILLAAVAHTFFNRSNNTDGLVADILIGSHRQVAALLALFIIVVVLAVCCRHRLTQAYRRNLDAHELAAAQSQRQRVPTALSGRSLSSRRPVRAAPVVTDDSAAARTEPKRSGSTRRRGRWP